MSTRVRLQVRTEKRFHLDADVGRPALQGCRDLGGRDVDGGDVGEVELSRLETFEEGGLESGSLLIGDTLTLEVGPGPD